MSMLVEQGGCVNLGQQRRHDALLLLPHALPRFRLKVILSGQVQQAVDDVEQNFVTKVGTILVRGLLGHWQADINLADDFGLSGQEEGLALVGQVEADDIGRAFVTQVLAVEALDLLGPDQDHVDRLLALRIRQRLRQANLPQGQANRPQQHRPVFQLGLSRPLGKDQFHQGSFRLGI